MRVVATVTLVCGAVSLAGAQPKAAPANTTPVKAAPAKAPAAKTPAAKAPAAKAPAAKAPPATPIGANAIMKLTADAGFVDDVLAYDNQRVAYVIADTSAKAQLHVVQLGCVKCAEKKQELVVDLSPVTVRPTAVQLVGQRAFVVGATEDGNQMAALVELGQTVATPVYSLGPAAHITVVMRDGAPRVAVHKISATKMGTRHEVELLALDTGKRIAAGKAFDLDNDQNKKLDFRVNHWADGFTRAIGLKGGEWVKKENQRAPDSEATYDLVGGTFVEIKPIADVVEQRKRYQVLANAGGQFDFVRPTWDNTALQIWHRGVARTIELDQPLTNYDITTLQGVVTSDGSAWVALAIDPVNPDAVARKKADPEYLDIFKIGPKVEAPGPAPGAGPKVDAPGPASGASIAGKGVRKARIPAKNLRFRFGAFDNYFWLLERSTGFDRGGRNITIYQPAS